MWKTGLTFHREKPIPRRVRVIHRNVFTFHNPVWKILCRFYKGKAPSWNVGACIAHLCTGYEFTGNLVINEGFSERADVGIRPYEGD